MAKGRKHPLDKFKAVLFEKADESGLTINEQEQLKRYRAAFMLKLDNPFVGERGTRNFLMKEFGISDTQAYRDLANVRMLVGNVQNAGKEWIRYVVIEGLLKQYQDADSEGNQKDAIMALDKLAKYNRLDKEDSIEIDWEKIEPIDWEAVTDVSVLGVKPIENLDKEIARLLKKYGDEIEIEDTDYEEVKDADS